MKFQVRNFLTLFLGLLLAGCDRTASTTQQSASSAQPKPRRFAMNVVVSGVPFWTETKATWSQLDNAMPDIELSFGGPPNTDAQRQIEEIEALINRKIDGLVIAPADSKALVPTINRAVEAGIPVVTYLVDAPDSKRTSYIASNQEADGKKIAAFVAHKLGNRGKIVVLYAQAGNAEQEARLRGVREYFDKYPEIRIISTIEDKYDEAVGSELLKPVLAQHKDIAAVIGCNSRSAAGTALALRESGFKPGQVVVTGWDFDNDLIRLIQDGWVDVSIAQRSEFMTLLALSILQYEHLLQPSGAANRRIFPEEIVVPTDLITSSNSQAYLRK